MRYAFAPVAFGLGANALVARSSSQCYQLKASGGASGVLGQLDDGQNRVGGGHPTGCYCLSSSGGFTDSSGSGCILTAPTTQFQCDSGASPTTGFAIGSNGGVTYNGSGTFYACPVNDNGEYNVYSQPVSGQQGCVEISLSTSGSCGSGTGASQSAGTGASMSAGTGASKSAGTTVVTQTVATETQTIATYPAETQPAKSTKPAASKPATQMTPSAATQPHQSAGNSGYPQQSQGVSPSEASECAPTVVTVTETAPAETQPAMSQPAMSQPAESQPAMSQPAKSQPAMSSQPAKSQPAMSQPAQSQPAMSSPAKSQPAMSSQPAKSQPAATYPAGTTPAAAATSSAGSSSGSSGACPADLNGNYEYPHLIVPVDSQTPSEALGTSYNGTVNSHTCTIFNFDIPSSMSGEQCSTIFLFPKKSDLETSSYSMSGSGSCTFSKMKSPASESTTWDNKPAKESDVDTITLSSGNSYTLDSGDCAAGQTVSYMMCSSGDFSLDFFEDYNPSPLGMYVRQC